MRIGCFAMPNKCKTHTNTLKAVSISLAIRVVLFFLLIAEGIESNPGPYHGVDYRGAQSPRGRGRGRGRGGRGGRGRAMPDIFADASDTGLSSQGQNGVGDSRYSLRRRPTNQPSVSDWLIESQPTVQPSDPERPNTTTTQSDMDLASETSETDDNHTEMGTTELLLEIRRDVKKMNKKFDHLERSVVMYDSYLLKDVHSVLVNFPREYAQESMMLYI